MIESLTVYLYFHLILSVFSILYYLSVFKFFAYLGEQVSDEVIKDSDLTYYKKKEALLFPYRLIWTTSVHLYYMIRKAYNFYCIRWNTRRIDKYTNKCNILKSEIDQLFIELREEIERCKKEKENHKE